MSDSILLKNKIAFTTADSVFSAAGRSVCAGRSKRKFFSLLLTIQSTSLADGRNSLYLVVCLPGRLPALLACSLRQNELYILYWRGGCEELKLIRPVLIPVPQSLTSALDAANRLC